MRTIPFQISTLPMAPLLLEQKRALQTDDKYYIKETEMQELAWSYRERLAVAWVFWWRASIIGAGGYFLA